MVLIVFSKTVLNNSFQKHEPNRPLGFTPILHKLVKGHFCQQIFVSILPLYYLKLIIFTLPYPLIANDIALFFFLQLSILLQCGKLSQLGLEPWTPPLLGCPIFLNFEYYQLS